MDRLGACSSPPTAQQPARQLAPAGFTPSALRAHVAARRSPRSPSSLLRPHTARLGSSATASVGCVPRSSSSSSRLSGGAPRKVRRGRGRGGAEGAQDSGERRRRATRGSGGHAACCGRARAVGAAAGAAAREAGAGASQPPNRSGVAVG
jgi:hypothetical protein